MIKLFAQEFTPIFVVCEEPQDWAALHIVEMRELLAKNTVEDM